MKKRLESQGDIERCADLLLREAGASGVFPTPVDEIVCASDLTESNDDLFEPAVLRELPVRMRKLVEKVRRKVLAALDRKEKVVYVNRSEGNEASIRFRKLHEVSHNIFPWQRELAFADDNLTLSSATRLLFEQEANQGAAELLFQRNVFTDVASDYKISLSCVVELSGKFGSSIHSSFRRYVETHNGDLLGIVFSEHEKSGSEKAFSRREVPVSPSWQDTFHPVDRYVPKRMEIGRSQIADLAFRARSQPLSIFESTVSLECLDGTRLQLCVEALSTTHSILVLVWNPNSHRGLRARRKILVR